MSKAPTSASSFDGGATRARALSTVSAVASRFCDPNADQLKGLQFYSGRANSKDTRIKQLQEDLISLGHLPAEARSEKGYGTRILSNTDLALRSLQRESGIPVTGVVDDRTVCVLAGRALPVNAPVPNSDALVGLKRNDHPRDATDTRIKDVQQNLIDRGYLDPKLAKDPNFGKAYGSMTESAVKNLQRDYGIPVTGTIDVATSKALGSTGYAPATPFKGAWSAHPELGGSAGLMNVNADGSRTQKFQNGAMTVGTDGTVTVSDAAGKAVATSKTTTPTTVADANKLFFNQEGNTDTYTSFNPKDATPYGPNDCGPTSGLIALGVLGLTGKPTPAQAPYAIDGMRDAIYRTDTTASQGMGMANVKDGLKAYGAKTTDLDVTKAKKDGTGLEAIDAALSRQHPIILGGSPKDAWAVSLHKDGNYLDMGKNADGNFGHFVAIVGKTPEGNYLLADPLSRKGVIEVTAKQIGTFLTQNGWGEAVEVSAP